METREQHLASAKRRALEYLHRGDVANAIASMLSDLGKHPETRSQNPTISMLGILAAPGGTFANCGRLTMRVSDFDPFRRLLPSVEFIEDEA